MISYGRYCYHLQDIAEIKAMPKPIDPIRKMMLEGMEKEVKEYELANPDKIKKPKGEETMNRVVIPAANWHIVIG